MHPDVGLAVGIGVDGELRTLLLDGFGHVDAHLVPARLEVGEARAPAGADDVAVCIEGLEAERAEAHGVVGRAAVERNGNAGVGDRAHGVRIDRNLERDHDAAAVGVLGGLFELLRTHLERAGGGVVPLLGGVCLADLLGGDGAAFELRDADPGLDLGCTLVAKVLVEVAIAAVFEKLRQKVRGAVFARADGGGEDGRAGCEDVRGGLAPVGEGRLCAGHHRGVDNHGVVGGAYRLGGVGVGVEVPGVVAGGKDDRGALAAERLGGEPDRVRCALATPGVAGHADVGAGVDGVLEVLKAADDRGVVEIPVLVGSAHAQELGAVGRTARAEAVPVGGDDARAVRAVAGNVLGAAAVARGVVAPLVPADLAHVGAHVDHDARKVGVVVVDARIYHGHDALRVLHLGVVPVVEFNGERALVERTECGAAAVVAPLEVGCVGELVGRGDRGRAVRGHARDGVGLVGLGGLVGFAAAAGIARVRARIELGRERLRGGARGLRGGAAVRYGAGVVGLGPEHAIVVGELAQNLLGAHTVLLDEQRVHVDVGSLHGLGLAVVLGSGHELRALKGGVGEGGAERALVHIARGLGELLGVGGVEERLGERLGLRIVIDRDGVYGRALGGGRYDGDDLAVRVGTRLEHGVDAIGPRFGLGRRTLARVVRGGVLGGCSGADGRAFALRQRGGQRERRPAQEHRRGGDDRERNRSRPARGRAPCVFGVFHKHFQS